MAKMHNPKFVAIVDAARELVSETTVSEVHSRLTNGDEFTIIDVREDNEWNAAHIPGAIHLGKGVLERDIETTIPESDAPIVLYCGGGYRSALAAASLGKMGYTNVESMDGGFRGWRDADFPVEESE